MSKKLTQLDLQNLDKEAQKQIKGGKIKDLIKKIDKNLANLGY